MENVQEHLQKLDRLIDQGWELEIIKLISTLHPADIADLIDALDEGRRKSSSGCCR